MASKMNPYLSFKGNAREAMSFYQSVFGGELQASTYGEHGTKGPDADKVMHADLITDAGYTLMASDMIEGMGEAAENGTVCVSCEADDAATLRGCFETLADGGRMAMPLKQQAWGDEAGMCTDKFGVSWLINIGGKTSDATRK